MQDFPDDLRGEVCQHLYSDFLSLPIFANAPRDCIKTIALQVLSFFQYCVFLMDFFTYEYNDRVCLHEGLNVTVAGASFLHK